MRGKEQAAGSGGDSNKEERDPSKRLARVLLSTLALLVIAFVTVVTFAYRAPSPGASVSLDKVYDLAERNRVRSIEFLDEHAVVVGRLCVIAPPKDDPNPLSSGPARPPRCGGATTDFHAAYPRSDVATQQLIEAMRTLTGAHIVVDRQTGTAVAKLVATFVLPLLMLANLFGLIFTAKSGDSSVSEIAGFGRLGRKRQGRRPSTGITFADVAGADEAVEELREVIDYLTNPGRFQSLGAAPPKGVLLFGPPGCGKTLLARATAGESGVPFFSVSGTEFVESLVGVGAARVRDLFRQVREMAPAIVFLDEIDAVGRRRSGEGSSGGEREQTLNQLLVEMDGFEVSAGIVVMGATNRPDILDPALMRPGRFDRHITLDPPDLAGRRAILAVHARGRPIGTDVDFDVIARRTPGFTGADLANVINEAALLSIRGGHATISATQLSEAIVRVLHGPQRRGMLLNPDERRRIAYHEAGHAVVAAAVGRAADVDRVSIVARGRALGRSTIAGDGERTVRTAGDMESTLAVTMGGVASEVLAFGEASTTAEDDIERATLVARDMVGLYGMSPELGRVRLLSRETGFLVDGAVIEQVSGQTMVEFDREVSRLIRTAEDNAAGMLGANRSAVEAMVGVLEAQETVEGAELASLLGKVRPATGTPSGNGWLRRATAESATPQDEPPRAKRSSARSDRRAGG